ncbi:MAG: hypothetical protein HOP08_16030 [Cyclobacteriaceae bacterium]|nr:hypothetical protein [Cyclobacteriaceae bacterium]
MKNKLISFLVIILLFGCNNTEKPHYDKVDISGIWFIVTNDSIYDEAIITKSTYWAYSDALGEIERDFKVEKDSFIFFNSNGHLLINYKFEWKDKNEFFIENSFSRSDYYRLDISLDTTGLIRGGNDSLLDTYVSRFREREMKWRNEHKYNYIIKESH